MSTKKNQRAVGSAVREGAAPAGASADRERYTQAVLKILALIQEDMRMWKSDCAELAEPGIRVAVHEMHHALNARLIAVTDALLGVSALATYASPRAQKSVAKALEKMGNVVGGAARGGKKAAERKRREIKERNRRIVARAKDLIGQGVTDWAGTIAADFSISTSQARRIFNDRPQAERRK